VETAAV